MRDLAVNERRQRLFGGSHLGILPAPQSPRCGASFLPGRARCSDCPRRSPTRPAERDLAGLRRQQPPPAINTIDVFRPPQRGHRTGAMPTTGLCGPRLAISADRSIAKFDRWRCAAGMSMR